MVSTTFAQMEYTTETGGIISNSYSNIYSNSIDLFGEYILLKFKSFNDSNGVIADRDYSKN